VAAICKREEVREIVRECKFEETKVVLREFVGDGEIWRRCPAGNFSKKIMAAHSQVFLLFVEKFS